MEIKQKSVMIIGLQSLYQGDILLLDIHQILLKSLKTRNMLINFIKGALQFLIIKSNRHNFVIKILKL